MIACPVCRGPVDHAVSNVRIRESRTQKVRMCRHCPCRRLGTFRAVHDHFWFRPTSSEVPFMLLDDDILDVSHGGATCSLDSSDPRRAPLVDQMIEMGVADSVLSS